MQKIHFSVSPFLAPSSDSVTHSLNLILIDTNFFFFIRCALSNFRFIPNFSIYPFDNGESWKEEEKNLFVQCKRINRRKQYNIFHIFFGLFLAYFLGVPRTKSLPSMYTHTHTNHNTFDAQQQKTDYQYSNKSEKKCQWNYIFSIDSPPTITIITTTTIKRIIFISVALCNFLSGWFVSRGEHLENLSISTAQCGSTLQKGSAHKKRKKRNEKKWRRKRKRRESSRRA